MEHPETSSALKHGALREQDVLSFHKRAPQGRHTLAQRVSAGNGPYFEPSPAGATLSVAGVSPQAL